MRSADLVRMARDRAGLTQAQLAARSGFSRETIARWESGTREPTLKSLQKLIGAARLELVLGLATGDESLDELVARQLTLSPHDRLSSLLTAEELENALGALEWLRTSANQHIVVGGIAAALQGGPQRPSEGSVHVVAADPESLTQELDDAGLEPVDSAQRWADEDRRWPWLLPAGGTIVVASRLPGSGDFKDVARSSRELLLDDSAVTVAHPRDLLRLSESSASPDERSRIPGLRALLRVTSDPERSLA